jgi:acetyl-CoA C-acetyltransferase
MRDVAIIGVGMTRFGELWDKSLRTLMAEAGLAAIQDAGVERVDGLYVGSMSPGLFVHQEHIGALMADYMGQKGIPAVRVESACASGGHAVRLAVLEVASGQSEFVMAAGAEKMNDGADATDALATAADQDYEAFHGITFPGLYALMARAYMERYGLTREQLAEVPVKSHLHGAMNPNAQFRMKVSVDDVINSTMVADPLRLLDCSPVTDGAAAVVVAPLETARKMGRPLVKVRATGSATDALALHNRADLTTIPSVGLAAERVFKAAGLGPDDIQFAEVHDCFSIAELIVMEELGFFDRGKAGIEASSGVTQLGGRLPINTSGGLKAKGHPVGASGVAQVIEAVEQLRGEAGDRQVEGARLGLTQNMGGSGASCVVHILEAVS